MLSPAFGQKCRLCKNTNAVTLILNLYSILVKLRSPGFSLTSLTYDAGPTVRAAQQVRPSQTTLCVVLGPASRVKVYPCKISSAHHANQRFFLCIWVMRARMTRCIPVFGPCAGVWQIVYSCSQVLNFALLNALYVSFTLFIN